MELKPYECEDGKNIIAECVCCDEIRIIDKVIKVCKYCRENRQSVVREINRRRNMKILLTGNKGFVGSHIETALRAEGHEIVGLEVHPTFREWYDEMISVTDASIEVVVHAGAMPYNQSKDPKLFLWNAHATYLLARRVREVSGVIKPFVYFSSFLVSSTQDDWESRTPYRWSKVCAEEYLRELQPRASILRPAVQWGDETRKRVTEASIPYLLATHQLENLFRHWGRSYVHILDVCEAIKVCLRDKPTGVFELHAEYKNNQQLAELIEWEGYNWIEDPVKELGYIQTEHLQTQMGQSLPNWKPEHFLSDILPQMEKEQCQ